MLNKENVLICDFAMTPPQAEAITASVAEPPACPCHANAGQHPIYFAAIAEISGRANDDNPAMHKHGRHPAKDAAPMQGYAQQMASPKPPTAAAKAQAVKHHQKKACECQICNEKEAATHQLSGILPSLTA